MIAVSVTGETGAALFSAEFSSPTYAKDFVEWRIEDWLSIGAVYVTMTDKCTQTSERYVATRIADIVFVSSKLGWRHARVSEAA